MSDIEHALIDAIEADPDDEAPRAVYADWLLERGDPRGELIQIQTARRTDPWWAHDRLARREARLLGMLPRVDRGTTLYDRGESGLELHVADHEPYDHARVRWLRPVDGWRYTPAKDLAGDIAALLASDLLRHVQKLDLSKWEHDTWLPLLGSAARPRHLILPPTRTPFVEALRDAPLLERVERLELRNTCSDVELGALLSAPWARQLVHLSLSSQGADAHAWTNYWRTDYEPISDGGIAALAAAHLPRLRSLDARFHHLTSRGIAALAASPLALEELQLSADRLGADAIATLDASRLAPIARTSLAGPWLTSPEPVVALVRSPTWRGSLDLTTVPRYDTQRQFRDLENEVLAAIAALSDARPLHTLSVALSTRPAFFESPIARSLVRLSAAQLPAFGASAIRLVALRLHRLESDVTASRLATLVLQDVRQLAITGAVRHSLAVLADAPLRPLDLMIRGQSTTGETARFLRSPILERVVDLTLAVEGNHNAKIVGSALLNTPYLQNVQRLELDFLASFPAGTQARVETRYGAALRRG